jgi:hypothetical protein
VTLRTYLAVLAVALFALVAGRACEAIYDEASDGVGQ